MSTFFSPGGVEELYPKLVGLSPEELSTVVEPLGSGIVGPSDEADPYVMIVFSLV